MLCGGSLRCLRRSTPPSLLHCLTRKPQNRPPSSRSFHASRLNQLALLELLEPISQTFQLGLQELHTHTGLPWYLTIPLGASMLRMTWIPVQIWTARTRKPRETVTQLTAAWRKAYQETARIKFPSGSEEDAKKGEAWVIKQVKARATAIRKHQSYIGGWVEPLLAVSFIPIWILGMDCIKTMVGDTRTITSILTGGSATVGVIEPGFDTESLSWIPSLAAADPLWIMPVAFGALSTYSMWTRVSHTIRRPKVDASARSQKSIAPTIFKNISYVMLALPSVFTCVIIRGDVATALVLYLLSVTATQLAQRFFVSRLLGTHKRYPTMYTKQAKLKGDKGKWARLLKY